MSYDYILVGGGLQNTLLALALWKYQPKSRVALIERDTKIGGNHTWSFYGTDVPETDWDVIDPIRSASWANYHVVFPGFERTIPCPYHSIISEKVDDCVRALFANAPNFDLYLGQNVRNITPHEVTTEDGLTIRGQFIVDARGPEAQEHNNACGFQKFCGLEVEVDEYSDGRPIIMDATVEQHDGFRFLYVLPFTNRRLLLEDTYFSDTPELDRGTLKERVLEYAAKRNLHVRIVRREEFGVLPMPWKGSSRPSLYPVLRGGYAGGWLHPATGYSFPVAFRLATTIAKTPFKHLRRELTRLSRIHKTRSNVAHFLNWLLFRLIEPDSRWTIFRRFYQIMPEASLGRFYALTMNFYDISRIFLGPLPRGIAPWRLLQRSEAKLCFSPQ